LLLAQRSDLKRIEKRRAKSLLFPIREGESNHMENASMILSSDAIGSSGTLDPRYTCDIDNSSPELQWQNAPTGTAGFAVIAEDPDAPSGLFTHWIIYNIPGSVHHLPAGIPPQESLPNGIRQGINSFGKLGYSGPCPPVGDPPHRYFFHLLALSQLPAVPHRIMREPLLSQLEPFIIARTSIMGIYQRIIQKAG
jgi:Raf kinase inhibitor-like YbhB/YbcL family protein